jgi:AraC-like DNA-binding protein
VDKTIAIIGLVQSLFGIMIFISKRPRHLSFVFLTIWLAIIAAFLGARLLPFQVTDYFKPGIFPLLLMFGPLLYLYVNSLSVENFRLKPFMLLHLIPLVFVGIHRTIVNPVPIGGPTNSALNPMFFYNKIYYSLIVLSLLTYWIFSLKLILSHRKNIPNHFSNYTSKNSLGWLISVLTIFLVLFVLDFSMSFISRVLGFEIGRFSFLSLNLTIFTFIMIFFGINQSVIYKTPRVLQEEPENSENHETRYLRSSLNEKQIEELTTTVFQYLKIKKPYLNPDFSLQMMAEDLNISRHKLSEAINNGQKKNFYKLINEFRVEEVKEMLVNQAFSYYTVLGIGLECGFNSKTSFNRIFKEETGLTPTEYKRTI